ncbi:hypothetical protein A4A49_06524 [Nicotiana attenuata]|uniref:Uncharacterized protein n=1 Tax=Nicotiana attenuata TaxID=49451 RepID=A0A1J6ICN1_NICAT|nr:hypothetical protein A4A49_06524 [Nicotiana attenuata]
MEDQIGTKSKAALEENMIDKKGKAAGAKNPNATIKPNLLETRVEVLQQPNNQQLNVPAGGALGASQERNSRGRSVADDLANAQANVTVNPRELLGFQPLWRVFHVDFRLGSIYDLQFKMLQQSLGTGDHCEMVMKENNVDQHDLVPHGTIEASPLASASRTGQPMQIQLNVPLKSHTQVLHDLVTHNIIPIETQALGDQEQFQEEGDEQTTAENFKAVARDADLSPRDGDKS